MDGDSQQSRGAQAPHAATASASATTIPVGPFLIAKFPVDEPVLAVADADADTPVCVAVPVIVGMALYFFEMKSTASSP